MAQELIEINHQVVGLDFRILNEKTKHIFNSKINGVEKSFGIETNPIISNYDDVIIVATKSYQLDDPTLEKLTKCSADLLFLQNGVLTKTKISKGEFKVSFGTITGIQANLHDGTLVASVLDSKIAVDLKSNCEKIKELIKENSLKNSVFENGAAAQIEIYEKFIRWVIISCLNIIYDSTLGTCLSKISTLNLLEAISELSVFVKNKFGIKVNQQNIFNSIFRMPKELKTSSYFDFKKGLLSEATLEIENVISFLTLSDLQCTMLSTWRKRI